MTFGPTLTVYATLPELKIKFMQILSLCTCMTIIEDGSNIPRKCIPAQIKVDDQKLLINLTKRGNNTYKEAVERRKDQVYG